MIPTATRRLLPVLLATLLLSACGGDEPKSAGQAGAGQAQADDKDGGLFGSLLGKDEPEPAAPKGPDLGQFQVVSVTLGSALDSEHDVRAAKTVFAPKDAIHAAVLSTGPHAGLTLAAHWTAADGTVVAHSEQALIPTGPMLTTFTLKNPKPWPAGLYQVAVQVDGHTLQSRAFEVAEAP
jgi:hypothetical protein